MNESYLDEKFDKSLMLASEIAEIMQIDVGILKKEIEEYQSHPMKLINKPTAKPTDPIDVVSIAGFLISVVSFVMQYRQGNTLQGKNEDEVKQALIERFLESDLNEKNKIKLIENVLKKIK